MGLISEKKDKAPEDATLKELRGIVAHLKGDEASKDAMEAPPDLFPISAEAEAQQKMQAEAERKKAEEAEEKRKAWAEKTKSWRVGDITADGSIYLGMHYDWDWFAASEDAKGKDGKNLLMTFNTAAKYAKNLEAHGHKDWKLPPGKHDPDKPDILDEMFNNKSTGAFKGTYNENEVSPSSFYWSSTPYRESVIPFCEWLKEFSSGRNVWSHKLNKASVRCVRSERVFLPII